ncbi:MAG TPA: transporter substrate-binding domain-containing protein [Chthoniobacterales bacterium]|nr:transporter substrate-binding domain-containing protein [Chthoniobacterales bacterium]
MIGLIGAFLAYLQWYHPRSPKALIISATTRCATLDRVLETKVLRVGFFHFPPLIDYDETATSVLATGLYAEILNRLAIKEGLRIEWCPLKLSEAVRSVTQHQIDCYACIMKSDVRYRECDFVGLLHSISVIGIVRKTGQSVISLSDLRNKRHIKVAVCQGEIGHQIASDTLKIPRQRLVELDTSDITQIISQVRDGHASVALADALSCKRMMKIPGAETEFELVFTNSSILTVPNGYMIAKDEGKFSDWFDRGILGAYADIPEEDRGDRELLLEVGHSIVRLV